MKRTFVMGDIHGAARAVEQCLQLVAFDRDNDRLIQLGDICDGFSESYEAAEILMGIRDLVLITGNHDLWLFNYFLTGRVPDLWFQQGGRATLASYGKQTLADIYRHRELYERQVPYYLDEESRLFVHGGLPVRQLEYIPEGADPLAYLSSLYFETDGGVVMPEVCWDRDFLQTAIAISGGQQPYEENVGDYQKLTSLAREFFVGHTALRTEYPRKFDKVWAMDTNCGWGGPLTIMNVDTYEIFQSDPAASLYPGEQARR